MSAEESNSQDSNAERNSKKKSKNKSRKKNQKKKHRKVSSDDDNSNPEENENEEEEEDSSEDKKKDKDNFTLNLHQVEEETIKKNKRWIHSTNWAFGKWIAIRAKNKSESGNKKWKSRWINLFTKKFRRKKSKLSQLIRTNKRQDEALINLKKQISIALMIANQEIEII